MNLKTVVPLSAAVVLGLAAAIVARQLISERPQVVVDGVASNIKLTDIVVAAHDIAPGAMLGEGDLTIARVESKYAPTNVASMPSALFRRVAKIQIPRGQIVHESLLAESGVSGGLPGVIRPGYRAMTIEVNEFTGVAGLLQPGNHIDVLSRFADGENGQTTRTVVQNVEIIAVGTELTNTTAAAAPDSDSALAPDQAPQSKAFARAITVLVTPAEAEKVDLAVANQARLVLRASTDMEKAKVSGATLATLRGEGGDGYSGAGDNVRTASHSPGDDIFSSSQVPTFKPGKSTSMITIIRAGVVSEHEVTKSKANQENQNNAQAGGNDLFTPTDE